MISLTILCNILLAHRIHMPCHISLRVQQFLVMKQIVAVPNCMWLTISYHDSRTDSICLYPICEFQQKATAGPTATTNRTSRGSLTNRSTALASLCVCKGAALDVTGLSFMYISCCVQIMYKFQEILYPNPLSSHSFLCTRKYGFLVKKNILDKSRVFSV